jgi:hypothetical protein
MSSEILIYQNFDGNIKIDVRLEEETVSLIQVKMNIRLKVLQVVRQVCRWSIK